MYQPQFTITNDLLSNIGQIEAAREVIVNAPLVPAYEAKFRQEALIRTVHHGTHLEGNDLSFTEAKEVIEGRGVVARDRDVQEVISYRNVLRFIDELEKKGQKGEKFTYTPEIIKKIHALTAQKILPHEEQGRFRRTQVVIKDSQTGKVIFRPPAGVEVPYLIEDFLDWLNSTEARKVHPVIRAGITHYVLAAIHPFTEGNGRTARAFATLVLFAEEYDIRKFFSLEEYFDKDAAGYYQALQDVSSQSKDLSKRDLTPWLAYFIKGLAIELARIKEKVKRLSVDLKLKGRIGKQVPLNERQIRMVEYLEENGSITMSEARKLIPKYSEDTLLRDLKYLMKKGIVKKTGRTKAARYLMR